MDPIVWEWVNLVIRWVHVITGIAWIGSSFYFIHLDASLRKRESLPAGVGGEAWQVHGGGFYHIQKYMVAPADLPDRLQWFKWEAYSTWLSGFALLVVLYYFGARIYLVDRAVLPLEPWQAVAIGIASLAAGWVIYDGLCKSAIGREDGRLAAVGFVLLVAAAWFYAHVFSGRGAYIHTGALIGTIMVANVFLVIIPNQKIVVADLVAGRSPDPNLGKQAKQRSLHNNYLTLPVLFTMISNHYPMTFGSRWNWVILAGVFVVGGLVRHFFNLKHQGRGAQWWLWPAAAAFMAPIVVLSAHRPQHQAAGAAPAGEVRFALVRQIIGERCVACHASKPTFEGIAEAPKGVMFDTPDAIHRDAARIYAQTVATDTMPLGNVTNMTPEERAMLGAWIRAGAKLDK
jgi:uncharacterized membrane protein